jgi:hypothetical protein
LAGAYHTVVISVQSDTLEKSLAPKANGLEWNGMIQRAENIQARLLVKSILNVRKLYVCSSWSSFCNFAFTQASGEIQLLVLLSDLVDQPIGPGLFLRR